MFKLKRFFLKKILGGDYVYFSRVVKERLDRAVCPLGSGFENEARGDDDSRCYRVLIVGWYGVQNFGDELMLKCMINRYKTASFIEKKKYEISVLLEKNAAYRFSNISEDVRCFYPPETELDLSLTCSYFDELVLGGGAHIDDKEIKSFDFIPYLIVRLSLGFLRLGKKVRWVAVSSNETLVNRKYIESLRLIAEGATSFSVRDSYSLAVLEKAGIGNVSLDRDIAFDVEKEVKRKEKIVIITFVGFVNEEILRKVAEDLFGFFEGRLRGGELWRLCFLPFYLERSADREKYKKILGKTKKKKRSLFYCG